MRKNWDAIDEQMEREGRAMIKSMRSVSQSRKCEIKEVAVPNGKTLLEKVRREARS